MVRPYLLVEKIDAAISIADAKAAEFAIYLQGGIEYRLWEK